MQDPRSTRIPVPVQKRPLPETLKMFDEFFPIEFFIYQPQRVQIIFDFVLHIFSPKYVIIQGMR